jgi:glycosyltransferase involved in cell wall biosynthesis
MQDRYHGIGTVTFELLRELCTRDVNLVVLHSRESSHLPLSELLAEPTIQPVPSYVPVASLRSQQELRHVARVFQPDVIYLPYHLATPLLPIGVPIVTMIQDCVFEGQTASSGRSAFSATYGGATRRAIRSSAEVLTPTQGTRRDIERFYGVTLPDEAVLPYGVGAKYFSVPARATGHGRPDGLPGRYILHVGTRRPHMNQKVLVEALAQLLHSHPDLGLVLADQDDSLVPDEASELIKRLGLADRVRQYARADDDTLLDLYANASVFAYPSVAGAFGLPVLEAMAAGLPVVASDAEVTREAAGEGALSVHTESVDDWTKVLDQVLEDPVYMADLRDRGMAVAAERTWHRTADLVLDALVRAAFHIMHTPVG